MAITVTRLLPIDAATASAARASLRAAGVKATVRRGKGSMRYTLTVTTLPEHEKAAILALRARGLRHYATDRYNVPLDGKVQMRFERQAGGAT